MINIMKLANALKDQKRYPNSLKKILEEEHQDNNLYILTYISSKLRDQFLIDFDTGKILEDRLWIYLKLEAMNYFKDLDNLIIKSNDKDITLS